MENSDSMCICWDSIKYNNLTFGEMNALNLKS